MWSVLPVCRNCGVHGSVGSVKYVWYVWYTYDLYDMLEFKLGCEILLWLNMVDIDRSQHS